MDSVEGKHVLVLPYPAQGHINPLLQLAKRLAGKGLNTSIAITHYIAKSMPAHVGTVAVDAISDGFDDLGFAGADSIHAYIETLRTAGSRTLSELIDHHRELGHNICCLVYDAFLPWALDVAKEKGLYAAVFFTQPCGIDAIYYHEYHKNLPYKELAVDHGSTSTISLPGLPPLDVQDLPSFFSVPGSYPAYLALVVNQFSNIEKADCVLINTFYELESEVVKSFSSSYS